MLLRQFAELLGDVLEDLPVMARFPWRIVGRGEGVEEGVQIGAGEVEFLVPMRRRQYDVGVIGRRIHPQVDVVDEVELAERRFVVPFEFLDQVLGAVLAQHVVVRAQQVLQRILVAAHRRTDQVAAPDPQNLRMVLGRIDIVEGELEVAALELLGDPVRDVGVGLAARRPGFLEDLERVLLVELRKERQPAVAHRQAVHRRRVLRLGRELLRPRRPQRIERHAVVPPLVGVEIEIGRGVHVARRRGPVRGGAERADGGEWPDLFGADIVREAAAIDALAAGQDTHHGLRAVGQRPAVIPVQDARAGDEQAFAVGLVRRVGPFAGDPQDQFAIDAGFLFLPRRRKGFVGIVVIGGIVAAQTAVDAELRQQ